MKFKVGQRVIFIAKDSYDPNAQNDSGKIAIITACHSGIYYDIFIESSKNNRYTSGRPIKVTWHIPESDLRLVGQLLFDFMYDG